MDFRRNPKTPLAVPRTTPHVRGYTVDPTRPINPATRAALYEPAPPIGQVFPPWSLGSSSLMRGYTVDPTRPINPATGAALYEPAPLIGQASPPGPLGSPIKDPLTSMDKGDLTPGAFPQGLPSAQPSLTRPLPPGLAPSPHVLEPPPSLRVLSTQQLRKITNTPDANRLGIEGTDLGVPVEHNGHLYLFFGDAELWGAGTKAWVRPMATAAGLRAGREIQFLIDRFRAASFDVLDVDNTAPTYPANLPGLPTFPPLTIPQAPQTFDVPTGAFSYGGRLHVFRMRKTGVVNADAWGKNYGVDRFLWPGVIGGRSVLESASDPLGFAAEPAVEVCDIRHFERLDELRTKWKFSQVCPQVVRGIELPELGVTGDVLLLWGTGAYRQSDVCFAWAPLSGANIPPPVAWPLSGANIPPPAAWRYFSGSIGGRPQFTYGNMESAIGLLQWSDQSTQSSETSFELSRYRNEPQLPRVGEFSVIYVPAFGAWLMLYTGPGTVLARLATKPWGPWGEPAVVMSFGDEWPVLDRFYAPFALPTLTQWDAATQSVHLHFLGSFLELPRGGDRNGQVFLYRTQLRLARPLSRAVPSGVLPPRRGL